MRPATQVIRAGLQPKAQGKPFSLGVTFAGTYHASGNIADIPYTYGRYHNPTWTQLKAPSLSWKVARRSRLLREWRLWLEYLVPP
jgi:hypothetical protein